MNLRRFLSPLLFAFLLALLPLTANAQTKPRLKKSTPSTAARPLVPVGTNLKVRLNDTLSSKESRAGDRFTTTVMDPARFNEATVHGHVRSIVQSGKVQGRTTINLRLPSSVYRHFNLILGLLCLLAVAPSFTRSGRSSSRLSTGKAFGWVA